MLITILEVFLTLLEYLHFPFVAPLNSTRIEVEKVSSDFTTSILVLQESCIEVKLWSLIMSTRCCDHLSNNSNTCEDNSNFVKKCMHTTLHSYIYNYIPIPVHYSSMERASPVLSFIFNTFFYVNPKHFELFQNI